MYNNTYNPYQQYMGMTMGNNTFPAQRQEVIRVNGKNGADAEYISCLIKDVNEELAQANLLYIKKKTCDFEIGSIMGDQEEKCLKYSDKIKEVWR